MKEGWILSYPLNAQRRLRSDWVYAQADLSLRWAHSHFVGFVMRRLKQRCTTPPYSCVIRQEHQVKKMLSYIGDITMGNPTGTPGQENVVLHRGCNPATCRYRLIRQEHQVKKMLSYIGDVTLLHADTG